MDNRRDLSKSDFSNGGLLAASESSPVTLERLYSADSLFKAASSATNKLRNQPGSKASRLDSMYYTLEYENFDEGEEAEEERKVSFFIYFSFSSFLLSSFPTDLSLIHIKDLAGA